MSRSEQTTPWITPYSYLTTVNEKAGSRFDECFHGFVGRGLLGAAFKSGGFIRIVLVFAVISLFG